MPSMVSVMLSQAVSSSERLCQHFDLTTQPWSAYQLYYTAARHHVPKRSHLRTARPKKTPYKTLHAEVGERGAITGGPSMVGVMLSQAVSSSERASITFTPSFDCLGCARFRSTSDAPRQILHKIWSPRAHRMLSRSKHPVLRLCLVCAI